MFCVNYSLSHPISSWGTLERPTGYSSSTLRKARGIHPVFSDPGCKTLAHPSSPSSISVKTLPTCADSSPSAAAVNPYTHCMRGSLGAGRRPLHEGTECCSGAGAARTTTFGLLETFKGSRCYKYHQIIQSLCKASTCLQLGTQGRARTLVAVAAPAADDFLCKS